MLTCCIQEMMCQQSSVIKLFGQTKNWSSYGVNTGLTVELTALHGDAVCTL